MESKESFDTMFDYLEKMHNVKASKQFKKDILELVQHNKEKFIKQFINDFSIGKLKERKRYERLKTNKRQNQKLNGKSLFRYEYRDSSNLRCIYLIEEDNNILLLKAFNEEKGKKKGKNSYDFNIELAIKIYEKSKVEYYE